MSYTVFGKWARLPDRSYGYTNAYRHDACGEPVILYDYAGDTPTLTELVASHHY